MDPATTNGLFALGGVALGSLPGIVGSLIDRRSARKDKKDDRAHDERLERRATYGAFLAAADHVTVLVRGHVDLGPKWSAHLTGGSDRELTSEETSAISAARQAASQAVLLATPTTRTAIDTLVAALGKALVQPRSEFRNINTARTPVIDAMTADLNAD